MTLDGWEVGLLRFRERALADSCDDWQPADVKCGTMIQKSISWNAVNIDNRECSCRIFPGADDAGVLSHGKFVGE